MLTDSVGSGAVRMQHLRAIHSVVKAFLSVVPDVDTHVSPGPQGLAVVAREQGWRALFAGLSINYLKVVPSTAIGFTAYDALKQFLDLPQNL